MFIRNFPELFANYMRRRMASIEANFVGLSLSVIEHTWSRRNPKNQNNYRSWRANIKQRRRLPLTFSFLMLMCLKGGPIGINFNSVHP